MSARSAKGPTPKHRASHIPDDILSFAFVRPASKQRTLPRITTILLTIAAMAIGLYLVRELRDFIGPVFFALNMMITAYPMHRWMVRHRFPSWLAATISGITMMVVLALILAGMIWSVAQMVTALPAYHEQFLDLYKSSLQMLANLGVSEEMIRTQLGKININVATVSNIVGPVLSSTGGLFSIVGVVVMAMVFMMMDTPGMAGRVQTISTDHPRFGIAMNDFTGGVRRYWLVTTVFGLIVAVLDGAVLIAVGVPLPLVWTLFSFLTNYIPNIGFIIGLIPPMLLALVDKGLTAMIIVVVAYILLNSGIQGIIQPRYTGDAVGVTPTVSFLSLLLWGWALGALGTILALPCTLLVKALLVDQDPKVSWINNLIASRESMDPAPKSDTPPANS